jgi:hypothetical protein
MKPAMRKNVIVIGVPRSGTSMTAAIFARNGYFAAQESETELRAGDQHNPDGYWEAERLIEANVDLFKAVGYAAHNTWLFEPISELQAERLAEVQIMARHRELVANYNAKAPWFWKDPRLCYTLGYWWPLVNQETTAVLLLTRNVDHVFRSFLRLGWRQSAADRDDVVGRLTSHMAAARRTIGRLDIPHITIDYADFEKQPEETARKIRDFFGLDIDFRELRFNKLLNHSSTKGRLIARLEKMALVMPAGSRRFIKKLVPEWVWNKLFPGHKR